MMQNPPLEVACLVVLVGPPSAGKSTWAKQNGRDAVHVAQDDLIDPLPRSSFGKTARLSLDSQSETVSDIRS